MRRIAFSRCRRIASRAAGGSARSTAIATSRCSDQCLELGFPAIKLHAWGDVKRDAELAVRLRAHVGDDVPLMYDGSAGFDLADTIALGNVLADAGYLWYEEPMREFSHTAYRLLSQRVDIPLLVAETSDGAHMNSADFIADGIATSVRTGTTSAPASRARCARRTWPTRS